MWQCRKIYANMLLLSVLLFTLGASAVPRINLGTGSVSAWQKTAENVEFRWECGCGEIVYRGQQLTAVTGSELEFIVPEKFNDVYRGEVFAEKLPVDVVVAGAETAALHRGRAPPEKVLCQ